MSSFIDHKEIESLSIVDFLARLGHFPVRKSGREYFYHSMLRDTTKNTPSFTVWDEGGKWIDRGGPNHTGIFGGGIIQLAKAYWPSLSYFEILQKIQNTFDQIAKPDKPKFEIPEKLFKQEDNGYLLEFSHKQQLGTNYVLSKYLEQRGIKDVALGHIWEVYFTNKAYLDPNKIFYGLGWQNRLGNWEITNPKGFKGSIGTKDISVIPGAKDHVVIFEGFMDYLSWLKLVVPTDLPTVIVLNSVIMVDRAKSLLSHVKTIDLYLDNDDAGKQCTSILRGAFPFAKDCHHEYSGFKDYNDKLMDLLKRQQLSTEYDVKSKPLFKNSR